MPNSPSRLIVFTSALMAMSVMPSCQKDKKETPAPVIETKFTDDPNKINVSTIAGTVYGYQDGQGTTAQFYTPSGIAIDALGEVYVADKNRIRKIDKYNVVSTLAGNGNAGYMDGSGPAAKFHFEYGTLGMNNGSIVLSDGDNNMLRKITLEAQVSTLAGTDNGYLDGPVLQAKLGYPMGNCTDASGNIIFSDMNNDCIRKLSSDGIVSTIAGIPNLPGFADGAAQSARFNNPSGIAIDKEGNIYVACDNRIRKIDKNGMVTSLGSGIAGYTDGAAATAQFHDVTDIDIDVEGNIIVADNGNNRIRKINTSGIVSTLAGNESAGFLDGAGSSALFNGILAIAIDANGDIYIADASNHRIRKIIGRK